MFPSFPSVLSRSPVRRPQQPTQEATRPPAPKIQKITVPYDQQNKTNLSDGEKIELLLDEGRFFIKELGGSQKPLSMDDLREKLENHSPQIIVHSLHDPDSNKVDLKISFNKDLQKESAVLKRHEGQSVESFVAQGIENALYLNQHGWDEEKANNNPSTPNPIPIDYHPVKHILYYKEYEELLARERVASSANPHPSKPSETPSNTLTKPEEGSDYGELTEAQKRGIKNIADTFRKLDEEDAKFPPQYRFVLGEQASVSSSDKSAESDEEDYATQLAQELKGTGRLNLRPDRLSQALHDKERLLHARDATDTPEVTEPKKLHADLAGSSTTTVEADQAVGESAEKTQAELERWLEKRSMYEELPEIPEEFRVLSKPGAPQSGKDPQTKTPAHDSPHREISERVEKTKTPPTEAKTKPKPGWTDFRQGVLEKIKAEKQAKLEKALQTPLREKSQAALAGRKPSNQELTLPPEEMKALMSEAAKQNPRVPSLRNVLLHRAHQHQKPDELIELQKKNEALQEQLEQVQPQSSTLRQPGIETNLKLSRMGREELRKAKQAEQEKAALAERQAKLEEFRQIPWEAKKAVALEKHEQWAGLNIPDTQYNPESVKENFQRLKQDFQKKWDLRQQEENPNRTLPAFRPGKLFDAKLKNQLGKQEEWGWHSRHQSIQDFPSTKIKADTPETSGTLKTFDVPSEYFVLPPLSELPKEEKAALKAEQKAQKPTLFKTALRKVRNALHFTPSQKTNPIPTEPVISNEAALREMLQLPSGIEVGTSETTIRPTGKTLSKRPSFQEIRQAQANGTGESVKNQTTSSKKSAAHHTEGETSGKFNPKTFWQSYREDLRKHREEEKIKKVDAENKKYFSEVFGIENFDDHEAVESTITKAENEFGQEKKKIEAKYQAARQRMHAASSRAEMGEIQDLSDVTDAREHFFEVEQARNDAEAGEIPLQVTARALRRMMATEAAQKSTTAPESSNQKTQGSPQGKEKSEIAAVAQNLRRMIAQNHLRTNEGHEADEDFITMEAERLFTHQQHHANRTKQIDIPESSQARLQPEEESELYELPKELLFNQPSLSRSSKSSQGKKASEIAAVAQNLRRMIANGDLQTGEIQATDENINAEAERLVDARQKIAKEEESELYELPKELLFNQPSLSRSSKSSQGKKASEIAAVAQNLRRMIANGDLQTGEVQATDENINAEAERLVDARQKIAKQAKQLDIPESSQAQQHGGEIEEDLYPIPPELLQQVKANTSNASPDSKHPAAWPMSVLEDVVAHEKQKRDEEKLQRIFASDEDDAVIRHIFGANGLTTPASVVRRTTREAAEAQIKADKARQEYEAAEKLRRHADAKAETSTDPQDLENIFKAQDQARKLRQVKNDADKEARLRKGIQQAAEGIRRKTEAAEQAERRQTHQDQNAIGNAPSTHQNAMLFDEIRRHNMENKPIQDIFPKLVGKKGLWGYLRNFRQPGVQLSEYRWDENRKDFNQLKRQGGDLWNKPVVGYKHKPGHMEVFTKTFPDSTEQEVSRAKAQATLARPDEERPDAPKPEPFWRFDRHGSPWGPLSPKRPKPDVQNHWQMEAAEAEASTSKAPPRRSPGHSSPKEALRRLEEVMQDDASVATLSDSELSAR